MKPSSPRTPSNLWSRPTKGGADLERLEEALRRVALSSADLAEHSKAAAERAQAFKTGVSVATLASRAD